jgi:glycosyltransferase involved in cell wall biosynthesis
VAHALRELGPYDVVQACEWDGEAALYALRQQAPLVTRLATPHYLVEQINGTHRTEKVRSTVVRAMEKMQARLSVQVISPSACLADVVARDWRLQRDRIAIVPTGVAPPTYDAGVPLTGGLDGKEFVIFFGKLEIRKGVKTWIDALPAVLSENHNLIAVFAGDDLGVGGQSAQEYAMRRCSPFQDRLVFFPRLPQDSLFRLVAHARLAVLPSIWESLANVCLEAMALGRPVVATTGSGFAEVITDGVDGILTPPGDSEALAAAVHRALARPAQLERIGSAALRRAASYNLERMAQLLVDVYDQVLAERPRRWQPLPDSVRPRL